MRWILYVATALVIVGGLNWGLVGAFEWNLVEEILGENSTGARVVYVLVGISAIVALGNFTLEQPARARH